MDKFVGREAEITRLAQLMISSSKDDLRRKVCILHGIGGVGKSQLAVTIHTSGLMRSSLSRPLVECVPALVNQFGE